MCDGQLFGKFEYCMCAESRSHEIKYNAYEYFDGRFDTIDRYEGCFNKANQIQENVFPCLCLCLYIAIMGLILF